MSEVMKTVYFLGAGATHADFPAVPLGSGLLHAVLSEPSLPQDLNRLLALVFDRLSVSRGAAESARPRLDDVLTLLETALNDHGPCPQGLSLEEVRSCHRLLLAGIGKILEVALGHASGSLAARLAKLLLGTGSTIVTTNYDIVMDNVLFDRGNVNYGVSVRSAVRRGGFNADDREEEVRHFTYDVTHSLSLHQGRLPLLKLNGSLNWLYCPRCDELDVSFHEKAGAVILTEPHLGRCSAGGCTGRYQALLVGPSLEQRYENRILRETWSLAERALDEAERLVIIGYSLPEADYLIRALLARHFARRSDSVTVVDVALDSFHEDQFEQRYKRLFPSFHYETCGLAGLVQRLEGPS
jgi:hypothetical protein